MKKRLWKVSAGAGHLVGPGGERCHRAGQGLPRPERIEGEEGTRRGTGREEDDHRLADGPRVATMIAATMPEIAAGTTTFIDVVRRRAPIPYDASRSAFGLPASRPPRRRRRAGW